jgi:hypothetical protein
MRKYIRTMGMLLASVTITAAAEATMVMPLSVEEMTARADKIFVGTCTKVEHSVTADGMPVIDVTFTVSESLKGQVGETLTFRQLDPTPQQPQDSTFQHQDALVRARPMWSAALLAGVPTYVPGEEAMLFLAKPGALGLTAPIGLGQGKLPVTMSANGDRLVTNTALKNTGLANSSLPESGKTGSYTQFVKTVRSITQPGQK